MAGIAGMTGSRASEASVQQMLATLRHRGRDHSWTQQANPDTALGVCYADLGTEKTCSYAQNSSTTVVFDGEIYNKRHPGATDAQVALELYRQHGHLFAAHLEGAFACAVFDNGKLVLARDSVGIRPLYRGTDKKGTIFFASEMKALTGKVEEVEEQKPATVFSTDAGLQPYVPVLPEVEVPGTVKEAKTKLRDLLFSSTEKRLADGAVGGMLLSGGLDSSIISAIANEIKPGIPAFTVGVEGAEDLHNAEEMASHLGCEHHIKQFGPEEIKALLPEAVYALESFDEDCVSGTVANLITSKFAFEKTNCILSGEGGDELNGGYLMLKELPNDDARLQCMNKLIDVAYNTALQRLDRAMMFNSINYRTPFLDSEATAFCLQLPVSWKVHPSGDGTFVEKWLLREAFKDMLPESIYRRRKLRFAGGTGTDPAIQSLEKEIVKTGEFTEENRTTPCGYHLNSPKELYYYRIFKERFPHDCFEPLVGRWDPSK